LTIKRSTPAVFDYVTHLENLARWQPGVVESKQTVAGSTQVGTTVALVRQFMGQRLEGKLEVTDYQPNQAFTIKMAAGPMSMRLAFSFEPIGEDTSIRISGELDPQGFLKLAEPLVAHEAKSQMEASLVNLKSVLEG
jgi:hypothetical protein